jgi:hypothetical protein
MLSDDNTSFPPFFYLSAPPPTSPASFNHQLILFQPTHLPTVNLAKNHALSYPTLVVNLTTIIFTLTVLSSMFQSLMGTTYILAFTDRFQDVSPPPELLRRNNSELYCSPRHATSEVFTWFHYPNTVSFGISSQELLLEERG